MPVLFKNFRIRLSLIKAAVNAEGRPRLALQLHIMLISESMGNHDSGYDEWRCVY